MRIGIASKYESLARGREPGTAGPPTIAERLTGLSP